MVSPQRRQQAIKPEQIYNQSHGLRQFEYPETESLADYLQTVDQLPTRLPLTQYQPNNHENQSMEVYNPNQKSFNGMSDRRPHLVHQTINHNAGNPSILISLNTTAGETAEETAGGTAGGTSGGTSGTSAGPSRGTSGHGETAALDVKGVKSFLLYSFLTCVLTCVLLNWLFGKVSQYN